MSFLQLHLPPDDLKPNRRWPSGTYLCRAIGAPEEGFPFTRLVVFKGDERTEKITNIEFISIKQGERDVSTVHIVAPKGTIPLKSEIGEEGIVCIMQENTPRCEECGLNLVKRFDTRKQEPYMVCPANRWGVNRCKNADRHDMNLRRETEVERKQRLKDQRANPYGISNWGEKYGLDFKSYEEYLDSDLWKRNKNTVLIALGRQCQICRSKEEIHVHHVSYERIGRELVDDLAVLCKSCHKIVHAIVLKYPSKYKAETCHREILGLTVKEFFAIKQEAQEAQETQGWRTSIKNIDFDEIDRETAEVITKSWKNHPATHKQNQFLESQGYKGLTLNKQEAFFKIREIMGGEFKKTQKASTPSKTPIDFEDPYFVEDQAERLWINSTSS